MEKKDGYGHGSRVTQAHEVKHSKYPEDENRVKIIVSPGEYVANIRHCNSGAHNSRGNVGEEGEKASQDCQRAPRGCKEHSVCSPIVRESGDDCGVYGAIEI